MPWLLLIRSPLAWAGLALAAVSIYAAVQHIGWRSCSANFAQFRAEVASAAAEAEVQAAQVALHQAQAASEVLSDLQTRYVALESRYRVLRADPDRGRPVPSLSDAAPSLGACPGDADKRDSAARRLAQIEGRILAVLEGGDKELAKYRELWLLQEKNAQSSAR